MHFRASLPVWSMLVVGALSLQASSAFAQVVGYGPRPERPDRGLFKSGLENSGDRLEVSGSAGAGWDNNILLDLPGVSDPRAARGEKGTIYTGSGTLSYAKVRSKGVFSASVASSTRYYPGQTIDHIVGHSGNVAGEYAFSDRTVFAASQGVSYQPFTFSSLFPGSFDPTQQLEPVQGPLLELAANKKQYLQYVSAARLTHQMTRRTSLVTGYHFDQSDTAYGNGKFTNQGGNAALRFATSKNLALRVGYGYQEGRYAGASTPIRYHNIDAGIDYNRALSFSRRTTVSFGTGSTAISDGNSTHFQVTGDAQLNHEIGRTWLATISYDRSFQFVSALVQPIFYDAASAGIGGLLNRRVRLQATARAMVGTMGIETIRGGNNDFDSYQGLGTMSIALTRHLDVGVNYTAYRYRFDSAVLLPVGVARNVNRQSVSVYVDLWAPLYNRARRDNASR